MKYYFLSTCLLALGCSRETATAPEPTPSAASPIVPAVPSAPPAVVTVMDAGATAKDAGTPGGRLCVQAAALKAYNIATLQPGDKSRFGPFTVALDDRAERLHEAGCFEGVAPGPHRVTFYEQRTAEASLAFVMKGAEALEVRGGGPSRRIVPQ